MKEPGGITAGLGRTHTYSLHFGYYDETATHHKAAVANMNRVMADLADIGREDKVLDAGCGVGGSGIWLAENRQCSVVGITPVAGQVKGCPENAQSIKWSTKRPLWIPIIVMSL